MEYHVLTLLKSISLHDINVLNGTLFTCKDEYNNLSPCLTCISCKLMIVLKFCISLLNHMTDQNIVVFILDCVGSNVSPDIEDALDCLLSPLDGKDRTYSTSRARPSLSTDIMDLSLKNHTVSQVHLQRTTKFISEWIVKQPQVLKSQFIVSILSCLKLAVLAKVYRKIDHRGKLNHANPVSLTDCGQSGFDVKVLDSVASRNSVNSYITHHRTIQNTPIDFISMLPVHISKYILNLLDEDSLKQCSGISEYWKTIVMQVRREDVVNQKIREQSMLLQEVSTKAIDPCYAKDADVPVPRLKPGSLDVMYEDGFEDFQKKKKHHKHLSLDIGVDESPIPISREIFNMRIGYQNIRTKNVIMEERNVYCGAYSVLLVMEGIPKQVPPVTRTISYNSGDLIAVSGSNKIIQFLDIEGKRSSTTKTKIHGHSGSIKVLRIIKKPGQTVSNFCSTSSIQNPNDSEVLSGSYDTTIRRWDIDSGKCVKIYIGHTSTISALDVAEDCFVSGSMDCTCKLWRYEDGNSILTMRHKHAVTAAAISIKLIVSGDSSGIVKVWNIQNGNLLKNLFGHSLEISAVRVDSFHILSASLDCYVLLWSTMGNFDSCIGCFRHPKQVLCMEMAYMRAITGSADGRIRIWNILNNQCIKIIRGNSKSDPILTMVVKDNRIVINTISSILVLNFENINWIYTNDEKLEHDKQSSSNAQLTMAKRQYIPFKHSNQRYERARFAGNIDPRLFLSPVSVTTESSGSNAVKLSTKESPCRQFEDGIRLTRASAWLVTPSLTKSIKLDEKVANIEIKPSANDNSPNQREILSKSENECRLTTTSSLGRRISYGFERQDHLKTNVELQDVKKTLRKNIRSRPITAAQAMPDFVKTMVLQMRESSATGRPLSTFSSDTLTRRSSGPSEIDLRTKSTAEEIKITLNPIVDVKTDLSPDQLTIYNSSFKRKCSPGIKENISTPNILSSAKQFSNRSIVDNFFVPKNYKQNLIEKKSEFDKRHRVVMAHSESLDKNNATRQSITTVANLNLKTFVESQDYLKQVNQIQTDYERTKLLSKESERYENWLRKVTDLPCPKYEKDTIMRRPRSAKM